MRFVLSAILFLFFGYALGLVIQNNKQLPVDLIFYKTPDMNTGLLLIVCILLGVFIGVLLSVLMFRVLQNNWELKRLRKENLSLQGKLAEANDKLKKHSDTLKAVQDTVKEDEPPKKKEEPKPAPKKEDKKKPKPKKTLFGMNVK